MPMAVQNLAVSKDGLYYLRLEEDSVYDVQVTLVKRKRDNSHFEHLTTIVIPAKQRENFANFLCPKNSLPLTS